MKTYFIKHKKLTVVYILSAIFAAFMTVCVAFIYQMLSNAAVSGDIAEFSKVAVFAALYFIFEVLSDYFPRITMTKLIQSIMDSIRVDIVDHYIDNNISDNLNEESSNRISYITNDLQTVEVNYLKQLVFSVQVISVFVIAIISSLIVNGRLAIVILVFAFIPIFSPMISKKVLSGKRSKWQSKRNEFLKLFEEFSVNLPFIQLRSLTKIFEQRLLESSKQSKDSGIDFEGNQGKTFTIIYGLGNIVYSGAWIIGGIFILNGAATLPQLIAMTTLMGTISGPIQAFSTCYSEVTSSSPIVEKVMTLINSKNREQSNGVTKISKIEKIELEKVDYGYKSLLLSNLSYSFRQGTTYAVKGKSGSGKTTLLQIILGITQPINGCVKINEILLSDLDKNNYYSKIAYIPQKTSIFEGSILENLVLFKEVNEKKAIDALISVGLQKFVSNNKIDNYKLSSKVSLSGGEERRLDIARGLYSEADVFVFDEPTSGVDNENENVVSSIIQGINDKIVIVVTHSENEKFLNSFDKVLSLENGQLIEIK